MILPIVAAVMVVSLLSLIGAIFLVVKEKILSGVLSELVAFATGALLGAAFTRNINPHNIV